MHAISYGEIESFGDEEIELASKISRSDVGTCLGLLVFAIASLSGEKISIHGLTKMVKAFGFGRARLRAATSAATSRSSCRAQPAALHVGSAGKAIS